MKNKVIPDGLNPETDGRKKMKITVKGSLRFFLERERERVETPIGRPGFQKRRAKLHSYTKRYIDNCG